MEHLACQIRDNYPSGDGKKKQLVCLVPRSGQKVYGWTAALTFTQRLEDRASINIMYTGPPQGTLTSSGIVEGSDIARRQNINPVLRIVIAVLIAIVGST